MSSKPLKIAILASLLLHITFFGLASWLTLRPSDQSLPGGSTEIVEVWISVGAPAGSKGTKISRHAPLKDTVSPVKEEKVTEEAQGPAANTGSGSASSGYGSGPGSDPTLSAIWQKINQSKYYPVPAKRQGIEGAPRVSFEIGENGKIKWANIVKSSGEETLDKAALEAVTNASPLPYYPKPITLTLRYSLRE